MRVHGADWTAEAHWRPWISWRDAGAEEGTFFMEIVRTRRIGVVKLLIKMTRRNRSRFICIIKW